MDIGLIELRLRPLAYRLTLLPLAHISKGRSGGQNPTAMTSQSKNTRPHNQNCLEHHDSRSH